MWGQLVIDSVLRPRAAARQILGVGLPAAAVIEGAVLVTCAGVILGYAAVMLNPSAMDAVTATILGRPLLGALVQLAALAVVVVLTVRIGRLFGGIGGLQDALTLVVWLNAVMVLIQAAQLVALALAPPIAAAMAIATIFWALWAFANFVAELHGFRNPAIVLGAVILTSLVLFFGTAMLLAILGITPQENSLMYDVETVRRDFPILARQVHGRPLVYLDNGASAQKPRAVIEAETRAYSEEYANVHRGLHYLSTIATEKYEAARGIVQRFLGAEHEDEIVFTTGSTMGINMVSYAWAAPRLEAGDEIVLSVMEHHANIVPWHFLRERQGVVLKWVEIEADGSLDPERVLAAVGPRTKLIAVTHMSNVLGTVVDVRTICTAARAMGVPVLLDGSQAAVHTAVDVSEIGCDFYVITGHKLYGPTGSGALYARRERLKEMRPFLGGGDMIREVRQDAISYADPPLRMEAGTPAIVQTIGLGVALDYMTGLGMENIAAHERGLRDYAMARFQGLNWLNIQGKAKGKGAIFSFTLEGPAHAHDISTVVDRKGVAVRAGHHCAQPLMAHLGLTATCRASFGLYNTTGEVDVLVEALETCHELFS